MAYNAFARQPDSHEEWKLIDSFNSTYWNGLDAKVYINNILLDEQIQVSYSIMEQVRPYYAYSSYVVDRMHHGARIIQGEITSNFKKDGFLFALLDILRKGTNEFPSKRSDDAMTLDPLPLPNTVYGPEAWEKIKTEGLNPTIVRDIANRTKASRGSNISPEVAPIQLKAGMFETLREGFDINIIFGSYINSGKLLEFRTDEVVLHRENPSFREEPYYVDGVTTAAPSNIAVGTGIKIIGVSFMGLSRVINDDGRPLNETFSFQARDIQILKNIDSKQSKGATLNSGKVVTEGEKDYKYPFPFNH